MADHVADTDSEAEVAAGWYAFLEDTLASSAEEAQGYRIMHEKAHKHYSKISSRLTIPAIILSTLTGVANFGQQSLEVYLGANAPLFIGVLSILAAILSTIAKYLRADEKSEMHRSAMVNWDKMLRMLVTVLAQPRGRRVDAQEFLLQYREERNRLAEQVPVIPYKIRQWFTTTYATDYSTGRLRKPGILALFDVPVYRSDVAGDPSNGGPSEADVLPEVPTKAAGSASPHAPASPKVAPSLRRAASPGSLAARMSAGTSHFTSSPVRPPPQLASLAKRMIMAQKDPTVAIVEETGRAVREVTVKAVKEATAEAFGQLKNAYPADMMNVAGRMQDAVVVLDGKGHVVGGLQDSGSSSSTGELGELAPDSDADEDEGQDSVHTESV
jgi:hypothetical protein